MEVCGVMLWACTGLTAERGIEMPVCARHMRLIPGNLAELELMHSKVAALVEVSIVIERCSNLKRAPSLSVIVCCKFSSTLVRPLLTLVRLHARPTRAIVPRHLPMGWCFLFAVRCVPGTH